MGLSYHHIQSYMVDRERLMNTFSCLKQRIVISLIAFSVLMLTSCDYSIGTHGKEETPALLPSQAVPTLTPTIVPIQTSLAYPSTMVTRLISSPYNSKTWETIYSYNQQITDGNLVFYAEEIDPECHEIKIYPRNVMQIRIVFRNISNHPLYLVTDFDVAPNSRLTAGDLIPSFYDKNGNQLFLSNDDFDHQYDNDPKTVLLLKSEGELERTVEISLPGELRGNLGNFAISPGQYLVKIIYHNKSTSLKDGKTLWNGLLTSNLIEFCMEQ